MKYFSLFFLFLGFALCSNCQVELSGKLLGELNSDSQTLDTINGVPGYVIDDSINDGRAYKISFNTSETRIMSQFSVRLIKALETKYDIEFSRANFINTPGKSIYVAVKNGNRYIVTTVFDKDLPFNNTIFEFSIINLELSKINGAEKT